MMRRPFNRAACHLAVAVAAASVVGCDDLGATDKTTVDKVHAAVAQIDTLATLAPGGGVETVSRALTGAADGAADGPIKAVAAGVVAAVDQQGGYAGVLKLNALEADVRRTLVDLRRLTDQVTTGSAYAAGYLKGDPKSTVADLSSHISAMQGNAQSLTWGGEKPTLPTLAAVKAEAARLQGELDQKQQQFDEMTKKRNDTLATAEVQRTHAESLKGEDSVRAYGDAIASRQAADDLAINIDLVSVQVDRLKSDLALNNAQAGLIETGVQTLKDEGKQLETDWVGVQKSAARQKDLANVAVEGDDQAKQSVKTTLVTLNKQLGDLATARSAVLEQMNEAKKYADVAVEQAGKFGATLAPRLTAPGKDAEHYRQLKAAVSQAQYQYRAGVVQGDRGTLELSETTLIADVKAAADAARTAIEAAGLTAPAELASVDTAAGDQLAKDAETDFAGAESSLTNVESGDAAKPLKNAAKSARLVTLFTHLQLYDLRAAAGDNSAAAAATQAKSDATALRDELIAGNVALPAIPGELGEVPPPATAPADAAPATPAATPAAAPTPAQ